MLDTLRSIGLAVFTCILVIAVGTFKATPAALPPLRSHPLPPTLAQWHDPTNSGDYFSQVKLTEVGYLVWSEFPIKVYVEPQANSSETSAQKANKWVSAVLQAVREWSVYLPLELVNEQTAADIAILRSPPPWRPTFDRTTRRFELPRVRTAETRYEFYIRESANAPDVNTPSDREVDEQGSRGAKEQRSKGAEEQRSSIAPKVISQKFTIRVSPNQAPDYILPSIRHELGHALGIWGHSPLETDALYFSQVRNPPPISIRDINTLKRIYQQPTRLGWPLPENSQE